VVATAWARLRDHEHLPKFARQPLATTAPSPRRSRSSRGRRRLVPVRHLPTDHSAPAPGTNRPRVSPRASPTLSSADPTTGSPGIGRSRRLPMARDPIAFPFFFLGSFV
jgi:hypothetical protein